MYLLIDAEHEYQFCLLYRVTQKKRARTLDAYHFFIFY